MSQIKSGQKVSVLGTEYEIVDWDEDDDEGELNGHTCELRISKTIVSESKRRAVFRHEIGHAVWLELGLGQNLAETTGLAKAIIDRIEEAVMCTFVPTYCDTLERNGFLVTPDSDAKETE